MNLQRFTQDEYNRFLDKQNARVRNLSQTDCERILMNVGATREQAKNGAYVYLHHGDNTEAKQRGSREEYERILNEFGAKHKEPKECINYLENMGYAYRQAQTALYNYRKRHGLIGK